MAKPHAFARSMERFSGWATAASGSSGAFLLAMASIVVWLASGPFFHYSDTWQLVINTSTTIVTFLMVFLIQRAQNKESAAMQLKLNELIAATIGASNHLIDVERRSEAELQVLRGHYARLVEIVMEDHDITSSHSVEEANQRFAAKVKAAVEARGEAEARKGDRPSA
jgi:low affinity Fe/Cu permease